MRCQSLWHAIGVGLAHNAGNTGSWNLLSRAGVEFGLCVWEDLSNDGEIKPLEAHPCQHLPLCLQPVWPAQQ